MHTVGQGSAHLMSTICKQLPSFQHRVRGLNCRPQRWEVSMLPLHHHGPQYHMLGSNNAERPSDQFFVMLKHRVQFFVESTDLELGAHTSSI